MLFSRNLLLYHPHAFFSTTKYHIIFLLEEFLFGEVNYLISTYISVNLAADAPHAPFRMIAPNGISLLLACYKSNTTMLAVLLFVSQHYQGEIRRVETSAFVENQRNLFAGFNGIQHGEC